MENRVAWWQGILGRSLIVVLLASLAMALASAVVAEAVISRIVYRHAIAKLEELLDTVERTASIACFALDEQLALEVTEGLLRNSEVARVVISAGDRQLAASERGLDSMAHAGGLFTSVRRTLRSPFDSREEIGEIRLDADWTVIEERIAENVRLARRLLLLELLLAVMATAGVLYFFVLRPIKLVSDRLHVIRPTEGERLGIPPHHRRTEIGRLVQDVDQLIEKLVAALEQERLLREQREIDQRKYRNLFENATHGIFVADRDGRLDSYNRAFVELVRPVPRGGAEPLFLTDARWQEPRKVLALLARCLDEGAGTNHAEDFLLKDRRGQERWLQISIVALGDGRAQGTVADVTERKQEELSARRLAITDPLTGFLNRTGLHRALAHLDSSRPPFALVMIDLDGFKQVNDAFGFAVGDALLLAVAARVRDFDGHPYPPARIGSDEFALFFAAGEEREKLEAEVRQLDELLAQPYLVTTGEGERAITIGHSMGIALFPRDGVDLHQLLRAAELALFTARQRGGAKFRFFEPEMQSAIEYRRRLEDDLRSAVAAQSLQLAFQPIVALATNEIVGAEALLRWSHPERGFVSPEVFIPLAEDLGLIGAIGRQVLAEACRRLAEWRGQRGGEFYLSINVSARQIPDELKPSDVLEGLRLHDLPPSALVIEITEGVLMSHVAIAQEWIAELRAAGIRVYLDDFGTGYSSLSYLKRFRIDTVKIDKSFVRDLAEDASDRALARAIVSMADSLGLAVVAEGVESEQQQEELRAMGCAYGQGYLFSRPVSADVFVALLEHRTLGV